MRTLLPLIAILGCGDDSLKVLRNAPAVVIQTPQDGVQFPQGEQIDFTGIVDDDSPPSELTVEWVSSIDGVLPDNDPPDPDGYV